VKSPEKLRKHTLNLRDGDYERLQALWPDVGAAVIIRRIISSFLDREENNRSSSNIEVNL
jgi:hypothetical protein